MSIAWKKRIVAAVLAACAAWPAAHHLLAKRLDFDPWNFLGWSMYAVPDPRFELQVAEIEQATARRLRLSPELQARASVFLERRAALGRSVRPDELAAAVLAARSDADAVVIGVRKLVIDTRTGMVEPRDEVQFRYPRGGGEP